MKDARPIHEVIPEVMEMVQMQVRFANEKGRKFKGEIGTPYLVGPPGITKTSLLRSEFKKRGWGLLSSHWSLTLPEEIGGIPEFVDVTIEGKRGKTVRGTRWSFPDILTQLYELILEDEYDIFGWLIDDMHRSSEDHIAMFYEMLTDRTIRGHGFPSNVAFVAAGNDSAKAGAKQAFSAITNRFSMIPVTIDCEWWRTNYAIPAGLNPSVVSFFANDANKPHLQEEEEMGVPWASARSWTMWAWHLSDMEDRKGGPLPHRDILYWGSTYVGTKCASKFADFYNLFGAVNAEAILAGKEKTVIPSSLADQYIYTLAITNEFTRQFLDYRGKDAKQDRVVRAFAEFMVKLAGKASEVGVVGLREIVYMESSLGIKGTYSKVKRAIGEISKSIVERLQDDIINI